MAQPEVYPEEIPAIYPIKNKPYYAVLAAMGILLVAGFLALITTFVPSGNPAGIAAASPSITSAPVTKADELAAKPAYMTYVKMHEFGMVSRSRCRRLAKQFAGQYQRLMQPTPRWGALRYLKAMGLPIDWKNPWSLGSAFSSCT